MKIAGVSILICACLLSGFCLAFGQSQKQADGPQPAVDCSKVGVDFVDDPNMTREERLEAMDRALQRSLGLYDECQQIMSSGGGASSASGAGSGGMVGAGSGGGSGEGSESAASGAQGKVGQEGSAGEDSESAVSGAQGKVGQEGSAGKIGEEAPVASVATSDIQGTGGSKSSSVLASSSKESEQEDGAEGSDQDGQLTPRKAGDNARADGGQDSTRKSSNGNNGTTPEDVQEADNDSVLEAQIREAAMREKDPEVRARLWNEYRRYKGLPQK
ncbi:MAG: hypothetical protein JEY79_14185 [Pseudodesulfovibrio sp.]|nr:hypothetical protein [Pseudodesulfovibrio sp.]